MTTIAKTAFTGGTIYELVCNKTGLRYIGKTSIDLRRRLSVHKYDYNSWLNGAKKGKCTSGLILENGDYTINALEIVPKDVNIFEREGYYQSTLECVNKNKSNGNASPLNPEYMSNYYRENKERIAAKAKIKNAQRSNCFHCGKELNKYYLPTHKKKVHKNIPIAPPIPII